MAWLFGKKGDKSELPRLPDVPELPPLPESLRMSSKEETKLELPPLPTFPSSIAGEKISNVAVKQAIREPFKENEESREYEDEEELPKLPPMKKPLTQEIQESPIKTKRPENRPFIRQEVKTEPIFVRLDKYQESLSSFQDIKRKALEIENLLKDIREIRIKEESELQGWEQEIRQTKEKLDKIDSTLFQKLG